MKERNFHFKKNSILKWFAPILLITVALSQIYLVFTAQLTPWKGGGFGMFAFIDRLENRPIHLSVITSDGDYFIVDPADLLSEQDIERLQSIPTDAKIERLASLAFQKEYTVDSAETLPVDPQMLDAEYRDHYENHLLSPVSGDGESNTEYFVVPAKVKIQIYKLNYDLETGLTKLVKMREAEFLRDDLAVNYSKNKVSW